LAGRGVLTVSDIDGFAEAGGGIGLVTEEDRVRFDINQAALTRDTLKASSQLLRLGRNVFGLKGL
ncbi:MAG TPA: YfiR family protein, partial [Rhodocyclaceae bacterium]|nr:YfiR family protein [Rhodocyclaceae bacterium]